MAGVVWSSGTLKFFLLGGSHLQAPQTVASAGRFRWLVHSECQHHPSSLTQVAAYDYHADPDRASCPARKEADER